MVHMRLSETLTEETKLTPEGREIFIERMNVRVALEMEKEYAIKNPYSVEKVDNPYAKRTR